MSSYERLLRRSTSLDSEFAVTTYFEAFANTEQREEG